MFGGFVAALFAAVVFPSGLARAAGPWEDLFDGRSLAGWLEVTGKPFPTGCWRIEEGCLRAFVGTAGMQDLRTVATFRSFDLEFEWKIGTKGNSGVKYLLQKTDEWVRGGARQARARGFEYQLADDANEEAVNDPSRATASLYSAIPPSPRVPPRIGEFNRSRIVVDGTHVEHWLNGTKVVQFDTEGPVALKLLQELRKKAEPQFAAGSPVSLQNHGSPVWFRSLRLRRLD